MTNVDFKKLDESSIKPLGLYGSKPELVRYMQDLEAVDDETHVFLLTSSVQSFL